MKKLLMTLLALVTVLCAVLILSSCGDKFKFADSLIETEKPFETSRSYLYGEDDKNVTPSESADETEGYKNEGDTQENKNEGGENANKTEDANKSDNNQNDNKGNASHNENSYKKQDDGDSTGSVNSETKKADTQKSDNKNDYENKTDNKTDSKTENKSEETKKTEKGEDTKQETSKSEQHNDGIIGTWKTYIDFTKSFSKMINGDVRFQTIDLTDIPKVAFLVRFSDNIMAGGYNKDDFAATMNALADAMTDSLVEYTKTLAKQSNLTLEEGVASMGYSSVEEYRCKLHSDVLNIDYFKKSSDIDASASYYLISGDRIYLYSDEFDENTSDRILYTLNGDSLRLNFNGSANSGMGILDFNRVIGN